MNPWDDGEWKCQSNIVCVCVCVCVCVNPRM